MLFGRKPTDLTSARIDGLADEVARLRARVEWLESRRKEDVAEARAHAAHRPWLPREKVPPQLIACPVSGRFQRFFNFAHRLSLLI